MAESLELYKQFIDDLVEEREDVVARRFREKIMMPRNSEELIAENNLIKKLNDDDRMLVSRLLQEARDGGVHDTLRYLNDEILCNGMKISIGGVELPESPFGMTMYQDWVGRVAGDYDWPDEE